MLLEACSYSCTIVYRLVKRKWAVILLTAFYAGYVVLGINLRASQSEMFSVPIQQFGRVGYCHGDTMDEETSALIDAYVPEDIWSNYNPPISDTIKGDVTRLRFGDT